MSASPNSGMGEAKFVRDVIPAKADVLNVEKKSPSVFGAFAAGMTAWGTLRPVTAAGTQMGA